MFFLACYNHTTKVKHFSHVISTFAMAPSGNRTHEHPKRPQEASKIPGKRENEWKEEGMREGNRGE